MKKARYGMNVAGWGIGWLRNGSRAMIAVELFQRFYGPLVFGVHEVGLVLIYPNDFPRYTTVFDGYQFTGPKRKRLGPFIWRGGFIEFRHMILIG